ncbi:MAG: pentapeptide repeat-containing protein [Ignavibacteriae bacterium]|nr:pentapeptide repeat-containing protein [Ignavibacteriota bacterium]MCB9216182.1 pentapeptide repeat-containing protein [Ignavibacteria bacterium]
MNLQAKTAYRDLSVTGEDYADLQIIEAEFEGCTFSQCNFAGANLSGSTFEDVLFDNCNLSRVTISDCSFRTVHFRDCKIAGVNFTSINQFIVDWKFERSVLEFCDFSGGKFAETTFVDAIVRECEFVETDLSGATFNQTDLLRSRFQRTNLTDADLREARNYTIDPRENLLTGAKFSQPEVFALLDVFGVVVE